MLTIMGGCQGAKEGLWRCQVSLRVELGWVWSGEERVVQIRGWRENEEGESRGGDGGGGDFLR